MKALKWIGVVLGVYVGLVLAFEGLFLAEVSGVRIASGAARA